MNSKNKIDESGHDDLTQQKEKKNSDMKIIDEGRNKYIITAESYPPNSIFTTFSKDTKKQKLIGGF